MNGHSKTLEKNIQIEKAILGVIDNPQPGNFMINNLYISFKRKRTKKKYLCFRKKDNKQEIYEISDSNIVELNEDFHTLIMKEKIDKLFFIEQKKIKYLEKI